MSAVEDAWRRVADAALGTCDGEQTLAERQGFSVDDEEVMDRLLDFGVERCPGCGWWTESSVMVEAEHGDMICEDCVREPE